MKKIIAHILAFNLLISSIGISVSEHYCLNFLRDTSVFSHFDEEDCCGIEAEQDGCCREEVVYKNLDSEYAFTTFEFKLKKVELFTNFNIFSREIVKNQELKNAYSLIDKPPPDPLRKHVLNSVFII